ncbi:MAG: hypothetical protein JXN61_02770 [Sedimentisphaerales bacterium]|nr:hypothetical protein [Sedimentisphaerales bacterium]
MKRAVFSLILGLAACGRAYAVIYVLSSEGSEAELRINAAVTAGPASDGDLVTASGLFYDKPFSWLAESPSSDARANIGLRCRQLFVEGPGNPTFPAPADANISVTLFIDGNGFATGGEGESASLGLGVETEAKLCWRLMPTEGSEEYEKQPVRVYVWANGFGTAATSNVQSWGTNLCTNLNFNDGTVGPYYSYFVGNPHNFVSNWGIASDYNAWRPSLIMPLGEELQVEFAYGYNFSIFSGFFGGSYDLNVESTDLYICATAKPERLLSLMDKGCLRAVGLLDELQNREELTAAEEELAKGVDVDEAYTGGQFVLSLDLSDEAKGLFKQDKVPGDTETPHRIRLTLVPDGNDNGYLVGEGQDTDGDEYDDTPRIAEELFTQTWVIPPVPEGSTAALPRQVQIRLEVDIDDEGGYDYEFIDRLPLGGRIQIIEVDAGNNLAIADNDGNPIENPIWTFCSPDAVKPVADIRESPFVFIIKVRANPKPDWEPRVTGKFVFYNHDDIEKKEPQARQDGKGKLLHADDPGGWTVLLCATVPEKVGKYVLTATITLSEEDGNEIDKIKIDPTFYVVFAAPKPDLGTRAEYPVGVPKEEWLETACTWAKGATTEVQVAQSLLKNEYEGNNHEPPYWRYNPKPRVPFEFNKPNWQRYIPREKPIEGNCYHWSQIWAAMARILGVEANIFRYRPGHWFITEKELRPIDGPPSGDIMPLGSCEPDRWVFKEHCVGEAQDGIFTFYDPTFGNEIWPEDASVTCHEKPWWKWPPGDVDSHGRYRLYVCDGDCECKLYTWWWPWSLPPCPVYYPEYDFSGSCGSLESQAKSHEIYGAKGSLTDALLDYGFDTNLDGLFDYLVIVASLDVEETGDYQLQADLLVNESTVVSGDTMLGYYGRSVPMCELPLEAGENTVNIYFKGRELRDCAISGPYQVYVSIFDSDGDYVADANFVTSAYDYRDFQPVPAEVVAAVDWGEDADGDWLFDYLVAELDVNVTADANYGIEAVLGFNDGLIDYKTDYLWLAKGLQKIKFYFEGKKVRQSMLDGPYQVTVSINDEYERQEFVHQTQAYTHSQFQWLDCAFTGNYNDYAADVGGDGLYDYVVVVAEVNTTVPGDYYVLAELENCDGNEISVASFYGPLSAGVDIITLEFDALGIFRHRLNGPCTLDARIYDQNGVEVDSRENAYCTRAYDYQEFRRPSVLFENSYRDYGIDENGNGLYEYLTIEADVNSAVSGDYTGTAWLWGGDIVVTKMDFSAHLSEGPVQLELKFAGVPLYERGLEGPYTLLYLAIYDEDGGIVNYDWNMYETAAYKCTEFEGIGLRGDLNNDGEMDADDLAWLSSHWLDQVCEYPLWCEGTDIDRSTSIDFADYAILADGWLEEH